MNYRRLSVFVLSMIAVLFFGKNAFAEFNVLDYANMYMTSDAGSTDVRTTFEFNEKPWLYINFKEGFESPKDRIGGSLTDTTWTWDGGEAKDQTFTKFVMGNKNELWIAFSDSYWKNNMQIAGDWVISATSFLNDKTIVPGAGIVNKYTGEVSYKVNAVPEPISCVLFLTGGAAIAAFRKKSKKA